MNEKKHQNVSFSGIITPAVWDENGNVLGISIHALDEKEYLIDPDQTGEELRKLLYEKMKVSGNIISVYDQRPVVKVKGYKIIEEYHDEDFAESSEESLPNA